MKKILLIILAVSTTLTLYHFFGNKEVEIDRSEDSNSVEQKKEADSEPSKINTAKKGMSVVNGEDPSMPLSKKEVEDLEARFDEIENEWLSNVEDLFINQLSLSQAQVKDYMKMREGFERDSTRAYENFHEEMVKKHGESYSYNPTEDEEAFQKEIRDTYEKLLLKKLGKEKFRSYLQLKDSFNERLIENADPEESTLLIEF